MHPRELIVCYDLTYLAGTRMVPTKDTNWDGIYYILEPINTYRNLENLKKISLPQGTTNSSTRNGITLHWLQLVLIHNLQFKYNSFLFTGQWNKLKKTTTQSVKYITRGSDYTNVFADLIKLDRMIIAALVITTINTVRLLHFIVIYFCEPSILETHNNIFLRGRHI